MQRSRLVFDKDHLRVHRNRFHWLAPIFVLMMLSLAACRSESGAGATAPASFKVALLTPGPVSDAGWNASAFDGLELIRQKLSADTAMVQTTSPADFEDAFRDFGTRGFKLIFAHGFEYTDTALKVAKLFPDTTFVVTSGSGSSENVASLSFKIEEAAYVLGLLATRPEGRVLISYIGNFEDVGAATEAALAQVSQGADLLYHEADAAGLGVFQAAAQSHIYAFGSNRNQNSVMPDTILASAVTDIPDSFLRIATEVRERNFHPAMLEYGMKEGMVKVEYNARLVLKVPKWAVDRANAAVRDIVAGKITFPAVPQGN